jgi:phosphate transport system permease protein
MFWVILAAFLSLAAGAFVLGRRRAVAVAAGGGARAHSQPGHFGAYTVLWTLAPAATLGLAAGFAAPRLTAALEAAGRTPAAASTELLWGGSAVAALAALAGLGITLWRIGPKLRARALAERWLEAGLMICSCVAIATAAGIVMSLALESVQFFVTVAAPWKFLTGLVWNPDNGRYGAVPLFTGVLVVTLVALAVAAPVGLFAAVYLAEYAGHRVRAVVKPALDVLAGVPAVVYGLFAVLIVGPVLAALFHAAGFAAVERRMALTAGVVIGVMLIPFVISLTDDILRAAPQSQRDGSYAMGATRSETLKHVVLPWASRGILGVLVLAVSRAVGETMVVTMAAGLVARATFNPLQPVATVTAEIADLLHWEQDLASPTTLAAFGLGLTLLIATLGLNLLAFRIVRAYRNQYD